MAHTTVLMFPSVLSALLEGRRTMTNTTHACNFVCVFIFQKCLFEKCYRQPVTVAYLIAIGRRDSSDGTRTRLSVRARRVRTPALQRPAQQCCFGALLPFHQLRNHGGHAFRSLLTVNDGFSFHVHFGSTHFGCTERKYNTRTSSTRSR